jgi:hypothetical protein
MGKPIMRSNTTKRTPTLAVILKGFEVLRGTLRKLLSLGTAQLQAQFLGNLSCDPFLDREDIGEFAVVLLTPKLRSICDVYQVSSDRQIVALLD